METRSLCHTEVTGINTHKGHWELVGTGRLWSSFGPERGGAQGALLLAVTLLQSDLCSLPVLFS